MAGFRSFMFLSLTILEDLVGSLSLKTLTHAANAAFDSFQAGGTNVDMNWFQDFSPWHPIRISLRQWVHISQYFSSLVPYWQLCRAKQSTPLCTAPAKKAAPWNERGKLAEAGDMTSCYLLQKMLLIQAMKVHLGLCPGQFRLLILQLFICRLLKYSPTNMICVSSTSTSTDEASNNVCDGKIYERLLSILNLSMSVIRWPHPCALKRKMS